MATTTTRLGLRKPARTDLVAVLTDLDGNYDAIDAAVGITVCTSTTRPSTPYDGQSIYETDTHNRLVWDGSGWVHLTIPQVASTASIINPKTNEVIFLTSTKSLVYWNGSAWVGVLQYADVKTALLGTSGIRYSHFGATTTVAALTVTSYTTVVDSVGNILGHTFVAPPSGIMRIAWGGNPVSGVTTSTVFLGSEVLQGAVVGSGTVQSAANDDEAANTNTTARLGVMRERHVTGLTPGNTYNTILQWHNSGSTSSGMTTPWVASEPMPA